MKLALAALLLVFSAAGQTQFERFDRDLTRAAAELHISDLDAALSESGRVVWKRGAVDAPAHTAPVETQKVAGLGVEWWYRPTSLTIEVPAKRLVLKVSANSRSLTEGPRLEDGNILRSPVALVFLRDIAGRGGLDRDERIDRALIALYFGQRAESAMLTRAALDQYPELESEPDVTLLYLFSQLDLRATESSATAVIRAHPDLPTAWFYYAHFLEKDKRYREAAACYHKITDHRPPWNSWTVAAAREALTHLETPQ